jgi:hypothetical protein
MNKVLAGGIKSVGKIEDFKQERWGLKRYNSLQRSLHYSNMLP